MYFEREGSENTLATVEAASSAAREHGIRDIVVASSSGRTALLLKSKANRSDLNIVAVTHAYGYPELGKNELSDAARDELAKAGIAVVTAAHTLSGAERSLSKKFGGVSPVEIIAYTLRFFGQGTKVAVEIATMALDAGRIPFGRPVISVGGSGTGADTALVLVPAYSSTLLETRIREVICKPRLG